jgi:hypothetical protein
MTAQNIDEEMEKLLEAIGPHVRHASYEAKVELHTWTKTQIDLHGVER